MNPFDQFCELVQQEDVQPDFEDSIKLLTETFRGPDAWAIVSAAVEDWSGRADGGTIREIVEVLFASGMLVGDRDTYDDPLNNFPDHCIESGSGLPITLCIVARLVARRTGAPCELVGLPGHVVLSDGIASDAGTFFDPFNGGRQLTIAECFSIASMAGRPGTPADLAPMSTRSVLVRVLNNLARSLRRSGNLDLLSLCVGMRLAMPEIKRADAAGTLALVRDLN